MTHEIRQGDIFWIPPDPSQEVAYSHPHVVVQDDVFNRSRIATVIVCALTTNLQKATEPGNVLLEANEGNLPKQSVEQIVQGLRFLQASNPRLWSVTTMCAWPLRYAFGS